jgi:Tfp pilus assembly protein PilF
MLAKYLKKLPAFFPVAAIFVLVLTAYIPALNSSFIWDDDKYVLENYTLRSIDGLKEIWLRPEATPQYYPLVHTVFWLEYHLWGLNPLGYHLLNILLHALNATLVFYILKRLSIPGAWLAALIFALHPVHVESVAWVTELKNLLSGAFYLSALMVYLRFDDPQDENKKGRFGFYILSFFLFVGALLSKTVTASLPLAILLLLWWKRPRISPGDFLPLIPMLFVGAGMGLMTAWMEKHHVMAAGDEWSLTLAQRVIIAGKALWFYMGKLIWPKSLTFIYPRWDIQGAGFLQYLYPLSYAVLVIVLYFLKEKTGKGPLVAATFFAVSLFPALGFFNVFPFRYSFVADHFQYLASLGIIAGIVAALASKRRYLLGFLRPAAVICVLLLTGTLWALTFRQSGIYRNAETLWRDTVAKNPTCWMAYNNLGHLYLQKNDRDRAEQFFRKAVAIDPGKADQISNMGLVFLYKGMLPDALREFKKAAAISPTDGRISSNLGLTYLQMDSLQEAEREFKKAIALDQGHAYAHCNLGVIYLRRNEQRLAELELTRALSINPGVPQAYYNLALLHRQQGKKVQAEGEYIAALKIMPEFPEAECGLAELYQETGRNGEAEIIFRHINKSHPGFIETE